MHACISCMSLCVRVCVPAAERLYSGVQSLGITPGQLRAEAWMSGLAGCCCKFSSLLWQLLFRLCPGLSGD